MDGVKKKGNIIWINMFWPIFFDEAQALQQKQAQLDEAQKAFAAELQQFMEWAHGWGTWEGRWQNPDLVEHLSEFIPTKSRGLYLQLAEIEPSSDRKALWVPFF